MRVDRVYFTITPTGKTFWRDFVYASLIKLVRIPLIYHLHGKGIREEAASVIKGKAYRLAFKNSKIIIVSNRLVSDIETLQIPDDNIRIVPHGIANDVTASEFNTIIRNRKEKSDRDPVHILFLSNMMISKGPLILLRAISLLKDSGIRFAVSFVGAWYHDDCRRRFFDIIEKEKLSTVVKYIGPRFDDEKKKIISHADIFSVPTTKDIFGLVNIEAMKFGLPVISTTEGAIPEIIIDRTTGFIVEPGDVQALANRLSLLIQDKDLRIQMGLAGRRRFLERYTFEIFENNMLNIFKQVV